MNIAVAYPDPPRILVNQKPKWVHAGPRLPVLNLLGKLRGRGSWVRAPFAATLRVTPDGYVVVGGPAVARVNGGKQCGLCGYRLLPGSTPNEHAGCGRGACPIGVK